MKTLILATAAIVTMSASAMADGFRCESLENSIRIKAYNQTSPELGTRSPAILVVSNPDIAFGKKTIATFESTDYLLSAKGAYYTADVDLRYNASGRKGELIAGTKLGELKHVVLDVDFSYIEPVVDGTELSGMVTLIKRNGEKTYFEVSCVRYLKGA